MYLDKAIAQQEAYENYTPADVSTILRPWTMKFDDVKVVFVGFAPYLSGAHNTGLAFSMPAVSRNAWPSALAGILKEYSRDLGYTLPFSGSLNAWHNNGVMLLNYYLSRENGVRLRDDQRDHQYWTILVYETLRKLYVEKHTPVAFVLFGAKAKEFLPALQGNPLHLVLCVPHPSAITSLDESPIKGTSIFSTINTFLKLDKSFWRLPLGLTKRKRRRRNDQTVNPWVQARINKKRARFNQRR